MILAINLMLNLSETWDIPLIIDLTFRQ